MNAPKINTEPWDWLAPVEAEEAEEDEMGRYIPFHGHSYHPYLQPLIAPYMTDWNVAGSSDAKVKAMQGTFEDGVKFVAVRWEKVPHWLNLNPLRPSSNTFELMLDSTGGIAFHYPSLHDYSGTTRLNDQGECEFDGYTLLDLGRRDSDSQLTGFIGLLPWLYAGRELLLHHLVEGGDDQMGANAAHQGIVALTDDAFCLPTIGETDWPGVAMVSGKPDCMDFIGADAYQDPVMAASPPSPFIRQPGFIVLYTPRAKQAQDALTGTPPEEEEPDSALNIVSPGGEEEEPDSALKIVSPGSSVRGGESVTPGGESERGTSLGTSSAASVTVFSLTGIALGAISFLGLV
ncbi:unnamed protein product [Chrysoparadoxa australica]